MVRRPFLDHTGLDREHAVVKVRDIVERFTEPLGTREPHDLLVTCCLTGT